MVERFGPTSMIEQRVAFGVCGAQAVVVLVYILYHAEPSVVVYTTRLGTVNGTSDVQLFTQVYGASPLVLLGSVLVLLQAAVTHQLNEMQILDNVVEFNDDSVAQAGMWNGVTWLMFTVVHAAAILCITSPVDTFLLLFTLLAILYSVACLCHPGMRANVTFLTLVYLGAMLAVFNAMPPTHGTRPAAFILMIGNDMLLVLGHVYDPRPNMLTVGNCRLVHSALSSLLLLTAYGI